MNQPPPGPHGSDPFDPQQPYPQQPYPQQGQYPQQPYAPQPGSYDPSAGPWAPDQLTAPYPYAGAGQPAQPVKKSRKGLWIGGGVVGVAAVAGAAAFGASWYFGTGAQPAEALPASTIGYLSIDLDPSGEQKVEALKTLQKFPVIREQLKLDASDDLRPEIFKALVPSECEVDYDRDVKPWLGERFAVAGVDLKQGDPVVAAVAQVGDEDAARQGMEKLASCGSSVSEVPVAFSGEWMVVSDSAAHATSIVEAAAASSLADDATYQKWTDEAGGAGIITAYAAPGAGDFVADHADDLSGAGSLNFSAASVSSTVGSGATVTADDDYFSDDYDDYDSYDDPSTQEQFTTEMLDSFRDFEGGAAAIRFADGSVEFELAGGMEALAATGQAPANAYQTLATLPEGTTAALAAGIPENFISQTLEEITKRSNGEFTEQDVEDALSEVGITIDDIEKVLGDRLAVVLGEVDATAWANADGPEDIEFGVITGGARDEVQGVLDKMRQSVPADELDQADLYLTVSGDENRTLWSPNSSYREQLERGGGLGNSASFRSVVEDKDAQFLLYADLDQVVDAASQEIDDPEIVENLEPLAAFGVSGSADGGQVHVKVKLSTD